MIDCKPTFVFLVGTRSIDTTNSMVTAVHPVNLPRDMTNKDSFDWTIIGQNVRRMRIVQGLSQVGLARRSGLAVSTVYHLERGAQVSRQTLLKVCEGLQETFDSLRTRNQSVLTEERDLVLFRREEAIWVAFGEKRPRVPEDDVQRIQHPEERLRLGRLGFVSAFGYLTNFIMPEGPGQVSFELYDRFTEAFNAPIYRDCLINGLEGRARLMLGETIVEIGPYDVVGFRSKDLAWMEPVEGEELPVRLMWTGAVRLGSPVREVGKGERVKRRKAVGEG